MKKIFLSPSNQTANVGAYKGTNECEQCERIAEAAKEYLLREYDCAVMVAERSNDMNKRAEVAKAFGAELYLAIHTNAFSDASVRGTETYYHSKDVNGQKFAIDLLKAVGQLTEKPRKSGSKDTLIEMYAPSCQRAYIEIDFHTNPERADWIVKNALLIGQTIGECMAKHMALNKKNANNTTEPEEQPEELKTADWVLDNIDFVTDVISQYINNTVLNAENKDGLYRVQIGAFKSEENARKLAAELKSKGYSAYITEG